jgi:hypothetical protein
MYTDASETATSASAASQAARAELLCRSVTCSNQASQS